MTRGDSLLIGLLAGLTGLLYVQLWQPREPATRVTVTAGAEIVARHVLTTDRRLDVSGPLGGSQLEIRDGAVRFVSSPCRHKVCVRSGWHRLAGSVAACVPNRVSVALEGPEAGFDALNY